MTGQPPRVTARDGFSIPAAVNAHRNLMNMSFHT
nr:MAG TPA: hypothetical protein [Caudoviricetes sp.]